MPVRRSRDGCRECRRRHRRCDEAKPACAYCVGAAKTCEYAKDLRWGGRPFDKSRFGTSVKQGQRVFKVVSTDPEPIQARTYSRDRTPPRRDRSILPFVYVSHSSRLETESRTASSPAPDRSPVPERQEDDEAGGGLGERWGDDLDDGGEELLALDPFLAHTEATISRPHSSPLTSLTPGSVLDILPREDRALFGYFQHQLTRSISCHEGMQLEICSALIPMAMQSRPVLVAILCTATCHRLSVGLDKVENRALRLRSMAIRDLNTSLGNTDQAGLLSALGASLALCLSDVASPSSVNASWHVYLAGASALLSKLSSLLQRPLGRHVRLLVRLYISFKSIAASCGRRVDQELFDATPLFGDQNYIDDLAGFSTGLNPVIQAMHSVDESKRKQETEPDDRNTSDIFLQEARTTYQYAQLICQVQEMLKEREPVFASDIDDSLDETSRGDFVSLDKAYHHMALLQLYNRADPNHDRFGDAIQASLRQIVDNIASMDIAARPCPAVATLPPLFEAGYWASSQQDRQRVRDLLLRIRACYGMGNVTCAMEFLEQHWDANSCGGGTGINTRKPCNDFVRTLGFLPY